MPYDENLKGQWVRRVGRKWHIVESIISGALITKCGRRLIAEGWTPNQTGMTAPSEWLCSQCTP